MKKSGAKNGNGNGSELAIRQIKELLQEMSDRIARAQEESARQIAQSQAETNKQIKETNKQLGALSNKWGSFTEGLAFPSVSRLLNEHFDIPKSQLRVRSELNGNVLEIDILGYNDDIVFVVEVKSHLREDGVKQIQDTLAKFPKFFPEHGDKRLYGMIAAVDFPEKIIERVRKAGLYLAQVQSETFEFQKLFPLARAKDFNPATKGQRRNGHH